jgi:hypothetical protein
LLHLEDQAMAEEDDSLATREARVKQCEVDAEIRDRNASAVAAEQRAEDRSLIERDILLELRERYADDRELELDERERRVEDRERQAELRQHELDVHQQRLDERDRAAGRRHLDQSQNA